jgi:MYXO-CTERM domain-containing protein
MFTRNLLDYRRWLALTLVLGCETYPAAVPAVGEIAQPVVNGQTAASCQWPSAVMVMLSRGLCTGTLVHPRVVTLAAHCQLAGTVRSIYFGEDSTTPARKVGVSKCNFYPDFEANVNDVAYCVLSEAVNDVPIAPVLMGCETRILQKGKMLDLVGFGITSMQEPASYGIKRFASVPLLNTPGPTTNIAQVGTSTSAGCRGDSGGPIFVRLSDGTWRTIGVASTTAVENDGDNMECVSPTNYVLLYRYIRWIESDSGIDITPCHDADGRWNPSAQCGRFATSADTSTGTWDSSCSAANAVSGAGSTCGTESRGAAQDGGPGDGNGVTGLDARLPEAPPFDGSAGVAGDGAPVLAPTPSSDVTATVPPLVPTLGLTASQGSGCSCHLAGATPPGGYTFLLPALGAVARRVRRRRKQHY